MKKMKRLSFLTNIIIFILLVISIGVNINLYVKNAKLSSNKAINNSADETTLWVTANKYAEDSKYVEIFDVNKGKVIQKVFLNRKIQSDVEGFFKAITDVYIKADALPKEGFIVRVPIVIPKSAKVKWFNEGDFDEVSEAFIIFNDEEPPYILVLDNTGKPFFYNFNKNTDKFLNDINFAPYKDNKKANINLKEPLILAKFN